MERYVYGMRLRGFSPMCQPMDGLIDRLDDKGADTPEKLAFRVCESNDCTECPATGMCRELMCEWECENIVRAWLMNENLLYSMAMERS